MIYSSNQSESSIKSTSDWFPSPESPKNCFKSPSAMTFFMSILWSSSSCFKN